MPLRFTHAVKLSNKVVLTSKIDLDEILSLAQWAFLGELGVKLMIVGGPSQVHSILIRHPVHTLRELYYIRRSNLGTSLFPAPGQHVGHSDQLLSPVGGRRDKTPSGL